MCAENAVFLMFLYMMIFRILLENAQSDAFSTENVMTDAEGREVHMKKSKFYGGITA